MQARCLDAPPKRSPASGPAANYGDRPMPAAQIDFVGVLAHLQGWLGERVAISAGTDAAGGGLTLSK